MKTNVWWKPWENDNVYSVEDVKELVEQVKAFNAGCIDEYLSEHVDKVFAERVKKHG